MGANTIGCLPRPAKTPQSHFQQHKASINSINTSKVSLYRLRQKHHHRHHCPCSRFNHGALISRPIKSCVNHYEVCESDYTGCPTDRGQSLKSDPKKHFFFFFFFFFSFLSVTLIVAQLVSWCFEPSQSQRITSGLSLPRKVKYCYIREKRDTIFKKID